MGHAWEFFREEEFEERAEDGVCGHGHEAVTLRKFPPSDGVRIGLVPAARVADRVTGKVVSSDQYFVELSEWQGSQRRLSRSSFPWDELLRQAEMFRGLSAEEAFRRWDRMGLGDQMDGERSSL